MKCTNVEIMPEAASFVSTVTATEAQMLDPPGARIFTTMSDMCTEV